MSKPLFLCCAVLCLAAALVAVPGGFCRAEWGEPSAAEKKIAEALNSATELEFIETPLGDVIATLRDYHEIEILIDQRALDDVGVPRDCPITISLKGISLRSALRLMLRELDLTYVIRDEVLLITTPEESRRMTYVRVYPVDDLVASGSAKRECRSLLMAIKTCVLPQSWDEMGGSGSISTIPPGTPKALVVTQSQEVHDELEPFLRALRTAVQAQRAGGWHWHDASGTPERAIPAWGPAERRIAKELKSPTHLEFIETPLQHVIDTIKDFHRIEIQIDQRALEDVGVPSDTAITINLKGVSLSSALRLMLRQLDLTYLIRDEVLLVTTPEEAETTLVTSIYPLNGLVVGRREPLQNGAGNRWKRWASKPGSPKAEAEAWSGEDEGCGSARGPDRRGGELFTYPDLTHTITDLIARESWSDVGGPGDLCVISLGDFEALVVMQTQVVHAEIAGLLARPEFRKPSAPTSKPARGRVLNRLWRR